MNAQIMDSEKNTLYRMCKLFLFYLAISSGLLGQSSIQYTLGSDTIEENGITYKWDGQRWVGSNGKIIKCWNGEKWIRECHDFTIFREPTEKKERDTPISSPETNTSPNPEPVIAKQEVSEPTPAKTPPKKEATQPKERAETSPKPIEPKGESYFFIQATAGNWENSAQQNSALLFNNRNLNNLLYTQLGGATLGMPMALRTPTAPMTHSLGFGNALSAGINLFSSHKIYLRTYRKTGSGKSFLDLTPENQYLFWDNGSVALNRDQLVYEYYLKIIPKTLFFKLGALYESDSYKSSSLNFGAGTETAAVEHVLQTPQGILGLQLKKEFYPRWVFESEISYYRSPSVRGADRTQYSGIPSRSSIGRLTNLPLPHTESIRFRGYKETAGLELGVNYLVMERMEIRLMAGIWEGVSAITSITSKNNNLLSSAILLNTRNSGGIPRENDSYLLPILLSPLGPLPKSRDRLQLIGIELRWRL
jgi:hypothetical protein